MIIKLADLRAAGLTEAQILLVVEAADTRQTDKRQEQNRKASQKYRGRHQNQQLNADVADGGSLPSLSTELTSSVSKEEERLEIVALGRDWLEFYSAYPHKVGKPKAKIAFERARKRAGFDTIMAGLFRYRDKTDDRPWCNPATWLNQDRWADQEGPSQEGNGKLMTAAVIEKREHELRLRLFGQGMDPYEIEQEVRRSTTVGAERPGNITQLRPSVGMVRGQN